MKFKDFLIEKPAHTEEKQIGGIQESDETQIASAAYKANLVKVAAQMERLNSNIARHQNDFARTNQKSWGYVGDMARLLESLEQINEWMDEAQF